jgi:hypothetical protein
MVRPGFLPGPCYSLLGIKIPGANHLPRLKLKQNTYFKTVDQMYLVPPVPQAD